MIVVGGKVQEQANTSQQITMSILWRIIMWRINSQFLVALAALYFIPGPPSSSKDRTWISFCHLLSQGPTPLGKTKIHLLAQCHLNPEKEIKCLFFKAVRFQYIIIITNIKSPSRCETQVKEVSSSCVTLILPDIIVPILLKRKLGLREDH